MVLCSGKVFYDLDAARESVGDVAVVRVEQFYPFPGERLAEIFASYPSAKEIIWTQEEPKNMVFVEPRLREIAGGLRVAYVGREPSASPATGSYTVHPLEQEKLTSEALTLS